MRAHPRWLSDPALAESGERKIRWAEEHSPVLRAVGRLIAQGGRLRERRIAMAIHLEAKTALLAITLQAAGAHVTVTGSNPASTQDDVCAALTARGIWVFARHGASAEQFDDDLISTLDADPEIVIDDGAELGLRMVRDRPAVMASLEGISEETTTGVHRYKAHHERGDLTVPVLAANDARMKHLFDNRYGTGHSSLAALLAQTNLFITSKSAVIVGFGWVGRGLARYFAGVGARITVCETDPVKLLEAYAEGYGVADAESAASAGDIFITATGASDSLTRRHFDRMRDGAVIANAGHAGDEIDIRGLAAASRSVTAARANITTYEQSDGRRIHVIAEGQQVNVSGFDGHPIEVMDLTFGVQALAAEHLAGPHGLAPGVHPTPNQIDELVARIKLRSLGVMDRGDGSTAAAGE